MWSSSCWQTCPLGIPSGVQPSAEDGEHRSCRKIKSKWVYFTQLESQDLLLLYSLSLFFSTSLPILLLPFLCRRQNNTPSLHKWSYYYVCKSFPVCGLAGLHNHNQTSTHFSSDMLHLLLLDPIHSLHFCYKIFLQDFKRIMICIHFAPMALSKLNFS